MKLIYMTASWCIPCRTFGPIMDQVTSAPVSRVDVDNNSALVAKYGVMSVPTVIAVDADGNEMARFSGAKSLDFVNEFAYNVMGISE